MLYEIHMLKNYPPVNLNRDDTGAPKSCTFGGTTRARISSQCLKRSWRISKLFENDIGEGKLGTRTRKLPELVGKKLKEMGVSDEYISLLLPKLSGFGNRDGKENSKGNHTAQVIIYAPEDIEAVAEAIKARLDKCASAKDVKALKAKELQESVKGADLRPITLDIALFGRMVTSDAFRNVDASMQVAHAISTNKLNMESDYFTAMDDLLEGETMDDSGAGHVNGTDYNSSCYYIYASLDTDILRKNLKNNPDCDELIRKAIPALIRTMALTNPSGKQNSFAGNVLPGAILVECKSEKVPVSLVNAFVKPVRPESANGNDLVRGSIRSLCAEADGIQRSFGLKVDRRFWFCRDCYDEKPESECSVCATLPELLEAVAAMVE